LANKKVTISIDSVLTKVDRGEVSPVYLLYGPDAVNVHKNKDELVKKFIPENLRDQNLKEFYASGTRPISLANIIPDVVDELLTVPFMFESRKVTIIYDPVELRKPKDPKKENNLKKDKEYEKRFCKLIDNLTPKYILIIVFVEDDAKRIELNTASKIVKKINENGIILESPLPKLIFEFYNNLLARNVNNAIKIFRELISAGQEAPNIFGLLVQNIRLLYQTKLLLSGENQHSPIKDEQAFLNAYKSKEENLPSDSRHNILKQNPFRIKHLINYSYNFTLKELEEYCEKLVNLDIKINPTQMDLYAPDPNIAFEDFIIDFCQKQ